MSFLVRKLAGGGGGFKSVQDFIKGWPVFHSDPTKIIDYTYSQIWNNVYIGPQHNNRLFLAVPVYRNDVTNQIGNLDLSETTGNLSVTDQLTAHVGGAAPVRIGGRNFKNGTFNGTTANFEVDYDLTGGTINGYTWFSMALQLASVPHATPDVRLATAGSGQLTFNDSIKIDGSIKIMVLAGNTSAQGGDWSLLSGAVLLGQTRLGVTSVSVQAIMGDASINATATLQNGVSGELGKLIHVKPQ